MRSFADQLAEVARESTQRGGKVHVTTGQVADEGVVRKSTNGVGKSTISFGKAKKRYKRGLQVDQSVPAPMPERAVLPDGELFVGEEHWRVL